MCTYVRIYVCVYICPWSGPPGAREERKRLSEPSWSPNKCVCALWMRVLAYFVLGELPPSPTGGCALPQNHLHPERS